MPLPPHLQQAVLSPFNTDDSIKNNSPSQQSSITPSQFHPNLQSPIVPPTTTPTTLSSSSIQETAATIAPSSTAMNTTATEIVSTTTTTSTITTSAPIPSTTAMAGTTSTIPGRTDLAPPSLQPTGLVFNAYASPYNLMKKPISSFAHASRQQRLLIPSIIPLGIDSKTLFDEREERVQHRMAYRRKELENDMDHIISELENDIKSGKIGNKIRAVIELKSLKLLDKQKKVI